MGLRLTNIPGEAFDARDMRENQLVIVVRSTIPGWEGTVVMCSMGWIYEIGRGRMTPHGRDMQPMQVRLLPNGTTLTVENNE